MSTVITTPRLILRQLVPEDFEALRRVHADPEVMWVYGGVYDENTTREWIQRNIDRYAQYGYGFFAITLKDSGELIGSGGLAWQETDRGEELEIGYQVRRDQQRRGYATEMARACFDYAFDVVGVNHAISLIRPDNMPSRRVAEKNGLTVDRETIWREQNHLVYRTSKEQWKGLAES